MDGRDSSPASAGEDERVEPVTDGLAKEAEALFSSRRFSECVDVLNQLLEKKEGDPKVLHNIAVAEYFRDGCSDPRKLLDDLNKVKKRSEELAHSSGDQGDGACYLGNNMSGSKGSGTNLHQLSSTDTSSTGYADQFDTSIISLNTAIVLYHLHEYAHARTILEPLYQNIDPIDETTALHVCLLLLDIAFASHDASKAADVIQYLEKCFGVGFMANQIDNGNTAHQSLNQGPKTSTTSNTTMPDASNSDPNAGANINENSLSITLSDDALEYESLYSTLDGSGQNLGRPSNDLAKASADRVAPATDLKLKMHLYKVRLLLLTRNLKAAKREVKLAMNMARGRDSSTELLMKSQLEYARGNHRKAVKLLTTSSNRTEPAMLSIFNNNLGCIHFQLRSHHTSGLLFSKALKNSSMLRKEKPLKLSTFSQDRSLLIMYNCGIQNLVCGNPVVAAQCFGKASLIFYNWPLLWLRLAECCLLALEKGLLRSGGEEVRVHVAGSGRWRQLVVDDLTSRNGYSKAANKDEFKLSLPFARYCLQNALLLLNKNDQMMKSGASVTALDEDDSSQAKSGKSSNHKNTLTGDAKASNLTTVNSNGDFKENKGNMSSHTTLQSSVAAYEDMRREENHMIRQAVLGALAYVELCLEDPLKALSSAKSLLGLPECSKIYVFLGRMFAAEALCQLNRSKEAAEHLSVYLTDGSDVELPYSNDDRDKWSIKRGVGDCEDANTPLPPRTNATAEESQVTTFLTPEEARGVALVNFSAMFAMQGDLEKASRFASQAQSLLPKHPKALLAAVYVDLLQERKQDALSKLKQYSHARFLSTDATLSS